MMRENSPLPTNKWPTRCNLRNWESEFVQKYLEQRHPRSLLVAAPGTGKTITALFTAKRMLESNFSSGLVVINDSGALRNQWKQVASQCGLNLSDSIDRYSKNQHDGLSISIQTLNSDQRRLRLMDLGATSDWFGVIDESHRRNKAIETIVGDLLNANRNNRFLFIAGAMPLAADSFDVQFRFNTEYLFQESIVRRPETRIEIANFAPSFSILSDLVNKRTQIDDLSWRGFEKLISALLERDGYEVELMRGTKDGGVDVVAVRDMGPQLGQTRQVHAPDHDNSAVGAGFLGNK
jgi:hypothetical protein